MDRAPNVHDGDSDGKRREADLRTGLSVGAQGLSALGLHVLVWNPEESKTKFKLGLTGHCEILFIQVGK